MTLVDLVLIVAVTWRLTRLLQRDSILDRPRDWLTGRVHGKALTLTLCPWCLSVYVAAAVVATWAAWAGDAGWWHLGAAVAAASAVTGWFLMNEPDGDD